MSDYFIEDIDKFRKDLHSLLRKDDKQALDYVLEQKMIKYPGKIESIGLHRNKYKILNSWILIYYIIKLLFSTESKVILSNFDKKNTSMMKKEKEKMLTTNKFLMHHVVNYIDFLF